MSFNAMRVEELQIAAARSGVAYDETYNKKELLAALSEANCSYSTYKKLYLEEKQAEGIQPGKPGEAEKLYDSVLLKMERQNPSFEAYGYSFTKINPFQVMSAEDAQKIIDSFEGFRIAHPAEAKSYYN